MTTARTVDAVQTVSYTRPRSALAARLLAIAFSGVMTLGMLASVNSLATSEPHAELLARVGVSAHT